MSAHGIYRSLGIILLLFGAGCAKPKLQGQYDLEVEIKETWQSGAAQKEDPVAAWWTTFQDSGLSRVIERTLQQNHDARAAAARVQAALTEARITGTELKPSVVAGFGVDSRKLNFIGFPFPGSEEGVLSRTFTTYGVSLGVSWEADLWGRLRSGEMAAYQLYEAQEAELRALQLFLAGQAARIWFASIEAANQLSLAKETVVRFEESGRAIRIRFEAGVRPAFDLRLALTDLASAESLVQLRQEQLDRSLRQLEILSGQYPSGALSLSASLPDLPGPVPAGIPAEMVARRPDLMAAQKRLLAADAQIAQSRAALYPQLSLTGSLGTSTDALKDLLDGDFSVWSLAGNLLQPVFQSGRLRKGVDLARARAEEALQSYAGSVLRALAEVESALAAEASLNERLMALQQAAEQAQAAVALARLRYGQGVGDVLSVLDSQRRVLTTGSQILTVKRERLDNRIDLHLALGGELRQSSPDPAASLSDVNSSSSDGKKE